MSKHYVCFFMVLVCADVLAQSCTNFPSGSGVREEAVAGILLQSDNPVINDVILGAMRQWNDCSGTIPTFKTSGSAGVTVSIVFSSNNSPETHWATWNNQALRIQLFQRDSNGNVFNQDELTYILAHELGHVLGLEDLPSGDCLMSPASRSVIREVASTDCSFVASLWGTVAGCCPQKWLLTLFTAPMAGRLCLVNCKRDDHPGLLH